MDEDQIKWLTKEFLELAINNGSDGNVIITNYSVKPAVESGNNYCTQLFRVKVNYERENIKYSKSLIVKAPLNESSLAKSMVDEADLLQNEYNMYTKILPKIYAISKHEFGPKTYFCENKDILIMDDLNQDGYIMRDRLQQLDFLHCKAFLTTLAKYHAATVALHNQDPELVESNGVQPLYNENMKSQTLMFFESIKFVSFVAILQQISGMEDLVETLQSCKNDLRNELVMMFQRRGSVNVLNHGDCWTNNIMFKYGKGDEISDCKLIDFQIRSYGSPAVDLLYFLITSTRPEVRQEHMDELLQIYCDTLNKTLTDLDCKERLSLADVRKEMKQASPWIISILMTYLPMILNEPDELSEELKKNEENLKSLDININPYLRLYLGKTYNSVLPGLCKDVVKLGVIDYFKNTKS